MPDISEYDKLDYDYSTYWTQRVYENLSEKNVLNKIFSDKRGSWFLDVGGSYGRLASTYANNYKNPIIIDYSLKTLQKNRDVVKSKYPNIELIAANAYNMPFKQGVFDGGLMVRVLHHIEEPKKYFKEVKRVLKDQSLYVQEFPNKIHIKATLKALLKLDFGFFDKTPYKQPIGQHLEGSKESHGGIFLNYHPTHIKSLLSTLGFDIKNRFGCSFLRSPLIKKILGQDVMLFFEKIMQNTLSWSNISPSIFLETVLEKKDSKAKKFEDVKEILACPNCKGDLVFDSQTLASCKSCSKSYSKKEEVWDFRVK
jgi:ubiquinone/menaquinone biosynthesis C-methylase UbiE